MAKSFTDYLTPDDIIELTGESRAKVFTELVSLTAEKRGVEPEDVFSAIMAREKIMSTAIGEGVAIPHGRMADLGEPLVIIGICREPVADYHALDGKPVKLVILVLVGNGNMQQAKADPLQPEIHVKRFQLFLHHFLIL